MTFFENKIYNFKIFQVKKNFGIILILPSALSELRYKLFYNVK